MAYMYLSSVTYYL